MARSWFMYIKTTPIDRLVASNYVATPGKPNYCCTANPIPGQSCNPNNICAVYATISATQPILTARLQSYLIAAGISPYNPQPTGLTVKKYVYTRQ